MTAFEDMLSFDINDKNDIILKKYMVDNDTMRIDTAASYAAKGESLEIFKIIYNKYSEKMNKENLKKGYDYDFLAGVAVSKNATKIIEWLKEEKGEDFNKVCYYKIAIYNVNTRGVFQGRSGILEYLLKNNKPTKEQYLEILKYYVNGPVCDSTMNIVVDNMLKG